MAKINLTDSKLRALARKPAPIGKTYDVMDAQIPGFGVRVSDRGRASFMMYARFKGTMQPTRRTIGPYPAWSLADARDKAAEWLKLMKRGIDPAIVEERARQDVQRQQENTVVAVAEAFIAEKLSTERRGSEAEQDLRREFIPAWGPGNPITEVTDLDVLAVINKKKRTAPVAARNLLALAKRFFSWVVDQRIYGLKTSPCVGLKPTKIIGERRTGERVLFDVEICALWDASSELPGPFGYIYRLLLLTAARLYEVADGAWTEFDPTAAKILKSGEGQKLAALPADKRVWIIPASRMKGERDHVIPLTDTIVDEFISVEKLDRGPFIFSMSFGRKSVWMGSQIKSRLDELMLAKLREYASAAGDDPATVVLQPWKNHDIRRTVRSNLSRLKISEEAREALLAHARPGIKGVYDRYDYLDEKREALELWHARLQSILNPAPQNVVPLHAVS